MDSLSWILLVLLPAFLVHPVFSQSSCYSGISDFQGHPLPDAETARYNPQGQQVIMPQLTFTCGGYISSWSAHTLVLTRSNFLTLLTHVALFQVWRPTPDNLSYTRVGSNLLEFAGQTLRDGITLIPGTNDTAFFSFAQEVPPNDQILVQPGDVVGWYVPFRGSNSPLSPLFRNQASIDRDNIVGDMMYKNTSQQECVYCRGDGDYELIPSAVPLVSVTVNTPGQDDSCSQVDQTCNMVITSTGPPSSSPDTTPIPISTLVTQPQISTAEAVCIAIASTTLALQLIIILICACNLVLMKQIKKALYHNPRTTVMPVTPGVRSPSTNFRLTRPGVMGSDMPMPYAETPAPYEAVVQGAVYETVGGERQGRDDRDGEEGSQPSSEPSLNRNNMTNSTTGSKDDLLKIGST